MVDKHNLSHEEGDTIKKVVDTLVDILVEATGGKPSFGNGKKK